MHATAPSPTPADPPPTERSQPGPARIPAPRRSIEDVSWSFAPDLEAVDSARDATLATLERWGVHGKAADTAVLVACELVSHTIEGATAPLVLHLHRDVDQRLWVGVSDGAPYGEAPHKCNQRSLKDLPLLHTLACAQGTHARESGTTHWVRLTA